MKQLILLFVVIIGVSSASGQTLRSYVDRLRTSGAIINQDETAAAAIGMIPVTNTVAGFRLCLFNGSDQNARGRALSIVGRLNAAYKNISAEMTYDAPVFKVYAGACLTRVEAAMLLAAVKTEYPEAFIVSERLPLAKLSGEFTLMPPTTTEEPTTTEPQ